MKDFFQELFEYNHHYNTKLAAVFMNEANRLNETSIKLFSHVLNAHHIWNSRILGKQQMHSVWEVHDPQVFPDLNQNNFDDTMGILNNFDMNDRIPYRTANGQAFENSVKDILFHVTNHTTYHRGQIASEFKQCGIDPLITDYIFYKRL